VPTPTPSTAPASKKTPDLYADALAKGYFGERIDTHPLSAYSLESGPDSPSAADAVSPKEA
jgi:hypothetical protein